MHHLLYLSDPQGIGLSCHVVDGTYHNRRGLKCEMAQNNVDFDKWSESVS